MVDGDIVLSTNNPVLLRGSMKDSTNPISYDKVPAKQMPICQKNFILTDTLGFGTKVGSYSNLSTIFEAIRANMRGPEQTAENEELLKRKKLLREINGQEIDRIKGCVALPPPKFWVQRLKYSKDDTPEEIAEKYKRNQLCADKKPYFMKYRYPDLNRQCREYDELYNLQSKCRFGMGIKKLVKKADKTAAEKKLVKDYKRFSPTINSNCTMNILCKKIEAMAFDIEYDRDCVSMLPYKDLSTFDVDPAILCEFREIYRMWSNKKQIAILRDIYEGESSEEYDEIRFAMLDQVLEEIRTRLSALNLSTIDQLTYFKILSLSYTKFNWNAVWNIIGDDIIEAIPEGKTIVPVETTPENGMEYLGRYFELKEVPHTTPEEFPIEETILNEEESPEFIIID